MSLKEWPLDERPREKLAQSGAERLTDSELLAILIRTGSAGRSAIEIGRQLACRGLNELSRMSHDDLACEKGICPSRADANSGADRQCPRSTRPISPRPKRFIALRAPDSRT